MSQSSSCDSSLQESVCLCCELAGAVFEGEAFAVRQLLNQGADPNAVNGHHYSALTVACAQGHLNIAKILLEKGADVNQQDDKGRTALMTAIAHGNDACVKLLLEHGADLTLRTVIGNAAFDAFEIAKDCHQWDILKMMKEYQKDAKGFKEQQSAEKSHDRSAPLKKREDQEAKSVLEYRSKMEFLSKENVQLKNAIEMTKKRENQLSVENRFLKEIQIRSLKEENERLKEALNCEREQRDKDREIWEKMMAAMIEGNGGKVEEDA